ncbi:MAG TPA: hypothetical protein VES68_00750 [Candidatus Sulfotelmatobacter sp.]|nr:hypothetical protein [Candidatus Sulfotelmatobacter sp.]
MNKYLREVLTKWIPFAVVITLLCGVIFVSVQQNYRMSANDPQIQLTEDVTNAILQGQSPKAFIPTRKLDLSKTLATFIILYDGKGKIIGSSVALDGKDPIVPQGVLDSAKTKGQSRITWQPKNGVREALVVNYYKGPQEGYVAIGRSLREVEIREENLQLMVFSGWLITLFASFLSIYLINRIK